MTEKKKTGQGGDGNGSRKCVMFDGRGKGGGSSAWQEKPGGKRRD